MSGTNKRVRRVTHKNGVELPTSVSQAKKLDEKNDNTLCVHTINREMENLNVSFDVLECGSKILVDHKKSPGYSVFDNRMTLERKHLWVKDTHRNPELE